MLEYSSPSEKKDGASLPLTQPVVETATTDDESSATFLEQFDELLQDIALAPISGENPGGEAGPLLGVTSHLRR